MSGLSKKAIATRESLKSSAIKLINANGVSNVRVEDITIDAGVAKGLFYRYFTSITDITRAVCEELFQSLLDESLTRDYDAAVSPYAWLCDYISIPVEKFLSNRGLLACMFELHGSFPEISKAWQATAHIWNLHLEDFIKQAGDIPDKKAKEYCYVLGAAMEGIIYQAIIRGNPDLKNLSLNTKSITETIARLWYRTIFLQPPPEGASAKTVAL